MHVHPATVFAGLLAAATVVYGSIDDNNSAVHKALYALHSSSTPIFQNVSGQSANLFARVLQASSKHAGACTPSIPCVNGACCRRNLWILADECGKDTCISNCDAEAECGQYASPESATCTLNVCCSKGGFCGTTEGERYSDHIYIVLFGFCGRGCQKGYGGCGSVEKPSYASQSMSRTIGYYEGWSATRKCDKRLPSDIDILPLTHINFAFALFHPTTFQILPMSANDEALYPQFTGLKSKKPSLKTWIAVRGWSFNDTTNFPNTQTAFSDMASSAASRRTFINSILHFMQTWGFDGVDLDWEYPGADDHGGMLDDTANFVELVRDMKNAFQGRYDISVTLPASYWYPRWFDLTGPYVRPHTNITEIKLSLDLLWRNNVDPFRVSFGLGWYGRSFTLKDPACNQPNCIFSYGSKPGECTNSAGILANSEIRRIITENNLTPTLDIEAAVKWISWDTDQWVSYDDGETIQMKIAEANRLCLGGVLIWAVDLDDLDHTSSNDVLGIGPANGVSPADAESFREQKESIERAATIANSCYWTFCGEQSAERYTSHVYARGQVPNIEGDVSCRDRVDTVRTSVRTLCCAPETTTGTCSWYGWNGVGMACSTRYCPSGNELIAMNTNSYQEDTDLAINNNLTCTGGAQSYCCSGFVPSQISNTDSLSLLGDYRPVAEDQKELGGLGVLGERAIADLIAKTCITKATDPVIAGSKSHSFQDGVVNRLRQRSARIDMQPPKGARKEGFKWTLTEVIPIGSGLLTFIFYPYLRQYILGHLGWARR
ncbi:killer toxin alpha/beta [Aspergillus germanicus]